MWLEIIELRSSSGGKKMLKSILKKLVIELNKELKMQAIKIYRREMIDSDFSIHLIHDSIKPEYSVSPISFRIFKALKQFGLINHSVWIEMQNN